jgi:hypothetical protein
MKRLDGVNQKEFNVLMFDVIVSDGTVGYFVSKDVLCLPFSLLLDY